MRRQPRKVESQLDTVVNSQSPPNPYHYLPPFANSCALSSPAFPKFILPLFNFY